MTSIIVARTPALTLLFAKMDVYVNDELKGRLAYGDCLKVPVDPGVHEVRVGETTTMSETYAVELAEQQQAFFTIDFAMSEGPRYWLSPLLLFPSDGPEKNCSRCGDFSDSFYEYNQVMCGPCLELFLQPTASEKAAKYFAYTVAWLFLIFVLSFAGCIIYASFV